MLNAHISMETIAPQLNDPVVDELERCYARIIDSANTNVAKVGGYRFHKLPEVKEQFDRIDKTIFDRFGIRIKSVYASGSMFEIASVSPPKSTALATSNAEFAMNYEKNAEKISKNGVRKTVEDISTVANNTGAIVEHVFNSVHEVAKAMALDKVKIDLKNARITGLPEEYVSFVFLDFMLFNATFKPSARELVAVLLHEIGHPFTSVEYATTSSKVTLQIINNVKNSIDKGYDYRDAIVLSYKNDLNGTEDLDKAGAQKVVSAFIDKYLEASNAVNLNAYHATNSEAMADSFTTMFGLGKEMASVFARGHQPQVSPLFYINASIFFIAGISQLPLLAVLPYTIFMLVWHYIVVQPIVIFLFGLFGVKKGNYSSETVYDDPRTRITRMKNATVSILRNSDLDSKSVKAILTDIYEMERLVDTVMADKTFAAAFVDALPANRRQAMNKKIEQLIENVTENSLHVAAARLKTIA